MTGNESGTEENSGASGSLATYETENETETEKNWRVTLLLLTCLRMTKQVKSTQNVLLTLVEGALVTALAVYHHQRRPSFLFWNGVVMLISRHEHRSRGGRMTTTAAVCSTMSHAVLIHLRRLVQVELRAPAGEKEERRMPRPYHTAPSASSSRMMAALMNDVLLLASLETIDVSTRVQTALMMQAVAEPYIRM